MWRFFYGWIVLLVAALAIALYGLIASGIGLLKESVLKELGFAASVYHT